MAKQINDKSNFMYSTTVCVVISQTGPPSVQHLTYEPMKCHSTYQGNTI